MSDGVNNHDEIMSRGGDPLQEKFDDVRSWLVALAVSLRYEWPRVCLVRCLVDGDGKRLWEKISAADRGVLGEWTDERFVTGPESRAVLAASLRVIADELDGGAKPGRVYFISGGPFIKIGWAIDPEVRLRQLQTGCPFPLKLLGSIAGTHQDEFALHKRFSAHRARGDGEWFHAADELTDYIRSTAGYPTGRPGVE